MSTTRDQSVAKSPLLWIALLVGAAAMIAVVLSLRDDGSVATGIETSTVVVSGTGLPPISEPDAAVGLIAPSIEATALDGDRVTLAADGTPRIIGFFAHWCPHCQREVPQVVDWLADDLAAGVDVVAVSTSVREGEDNYPPSAWFAREEWPNTVLVDSTSSEIAQSFGLTGFPYWVALDGDGAVVARAAGEIGQERFIELVQAAAA